MTPRYAMWMDMIAQRDAALLMFAGLAAFAAGGFALLLETPTPDLKLLWRVLGWVYSGLWLVTFIVMLIMIVLGGEN